MKKKLAPNHLLSFAWYAPHQAWIVDNGGCTPHDSGDASPARACLSGANLAWADLRKADLTGADLTGATLNGAVLTEADLTGASLIGATMPDGLTRKGMNE